MNSTEAEEEEELHEGHMNPGALSLKPGVLFLHLNVWNMLKLYMFSSLY